MKTPRHQVLIAIGDCQQLLDSFDTCPAIPDCICHATSKYQLFTRNSELARALRYTKRLCKHFKMTTSLRIAA
jgi:hypothetical protein